MDRVTYILVALERPSSTGNPANSARRILDANKSTRSFQFFANFLKQKEAGDCTGEGEACHRVVQIVQFIFVVK